MKSERTYPVYKVNKHAEGLLVGGHPWVYENDILEAPGTAPENGTLVDVVSPKGAYLGTGFLSLQSKIRVRLISRNANDTFDAAFWRRRVEYAWAYRKTVLEPADLSACRFIFGEADQFPGLTVDRFNNVLVTQTLSVGMEKLKPMLSRFWLRCCGRTDRPLTASMSATTKPCAPRRGWNKTRAGSPCPARATRKPPRPRSAKTASTTMWTLKTGKRPDFSLTRNIIVGR